MWPFTSSDDPMDEMIAEAIDLASEQWEAFNARSALAPNIHLRDRTSFFAAEFQPILFDAYSDLEAAPPELLLLIIAEGIAASGSHSRRQIELELGITLPD
jgi:hypothetical protein